MHNTYQATMPAPVAGTHAANADAGSCRRSPRHRVPMDEDSTYYYFDANDDEGSITLIL